MPVSMHDLVSDLAAESASLRTLIASLDERDWQRATPAVGWTVADQVSHLAHFDDVAVQSAVDQQAFRRELDRIEGEGGINPDAIADSYRWMNGAALLRWFDEARSRLIETFADLEPGLRVPWFGPPMSAASSVTARIMETWAHGQDIADTFGTCREPNARLRHVAHIGVGARAYSYAANGLTAPDDPIHVELSAPDGSIWRWGPPGTPDRVRGDALQFCLAVTQRRHLDDLELSVVGPEATRWMSIAQAFAGGAGTGRSPGTSDGPR